MPHQTWRHLSADEVTALLPDPVTATDLAEQALVALAGRRADVPPKPAVALPGDGFANAMPAGLADQGLVGCKWLTVLPDNPACGLPAIQGLMIVNDARTGQVRAVMDAGPLTALRTAAVTGACVRRLADLDAPVAFLGTGVQARSHLTVLTALGVAQVRVYGRRATAREELGRWCAEHVPDLSVTLVDDPYDAVSDAGTVVSGLPIGLQGQELDPARVRDDVLLLPLDYASTVGADLARTATVVSDDVDQLTAVAPDKLSPDYPAATGWTGDALQGARPAGRLVCQNLGSGACDLVLAGWVSDEADRRDVGRLLPR
ncbi:ornithine cyclodeaminase family protein [Arsenicicoccus dermatophilus]|uniref:ornithine cyclodeaminase family protein n=1 Tax=Arsenicicoccus dermatophilus TaxID=1076331 RepID=UPI001F4CA9B0|nr:ornithine cyclodeaminase family protein [Arsenicicoccus dermatophilus]MCH8613004.1 ornithine cyclodeaminase family protein [Arsenicicoccus dermatophilus]